LNAYAFYFNPNVTVCVVGTRQAKLAERVVAGAADANLENVKQASKFAARRLIEKATAHADQVQAGAVEATRRVMRVSTDAAVVESIARGADQGLQKAAKDVTSAAIQATEANTAAVVGNAIGGALRSGVSSAASGLVLKFAWDICRYGVGRWKPEEDGRFLDKLKDKTIPSAIVDGVTSFGVASVVGTVGIPAIAVGVVARMGVHYAIGH
jgi:hypothetical protein